MIKKILLGILVLIVILIVVVALQPADFKIARSTMVNAAPAVLYEQVNDFHNWNNWSPWAKLDPAMKQTFEGPSAGKGAIYTWSGNNEVGEGKMTILESKPNELVLIQLEFIKPFAATNIAEFSFAPQSAGQTQVTWAMTGKNNFIAKAFHMVMNIDKLVGGDFEKGLAAMKAVAEGPTTKPATNPTMNPI